MARRKLFLSDALGLIILSMRKGAVAFALMNRILCYDWLTLVCIPGSLRLIRLAQRRDQLQTGLFTKRNRTRSTNPENQELQFKAEYFTSLFSFMSHGNRSSLKEYFEGMFLYPFNPPAYLDGFFRMFSVYCGVPLIFPNSEVENRTK